jgi:molybdate transport system regulatory protein
MDLDADFDAQLDKSGVRFTERDVKLLRAIYQHGSLNRAANALGRSYSHSQQRVVELEGAFGQLVERTRGGSGGGGSSLTETTEQLLAEFDRLEAEFTGLTEVEETVLRGTVVKRDGELGTVETEAGLVRAIVPSTPRKVRVAIRADAITLHAPGSLPETKTSARNRFESTVRDIVVGDTIAQIGLDINAETDMTVLVTQTSVETLDLTPGDVVVATFKATATQASPANSYRSTQSEQDSSV